MLWAARCSVKLVPAVSWQGEHARTRGCLPVPKARVLYIRKRARRGVPLPYTMAGITLKSASPAGSAAEREQWVQQTLAGMSPDEVYTAMK